jgi:hypothetical protein
MAHDLPEVNGELDVLGRFLALGHCHNRAVEQDCGLCGEDNSVVALALCNKIFRISSH